MKVRPVSVVRMWDVQCSQAHARGNRDGATTGPPARGSRVKPLPAVGLTARRGPELAGTRDPEVDCTTATWEFCSTCRQSRAAKVVGFEHQSAILNRSRPSRLRLIAVDRVLWAWLSRAWSGWRPAPVLVKPETVLAWHRRGFRLGPDLEESVPNGSSSRGSRGPRVDSSNGHGESALGCTADSWGTTEAGDHPVSQATVAKVQAATRHATITTVAKLPGQPCRPDHGCRLLRRANGDLPPVVWTRILRARPATDRPRRRHRPSHGRMDGPTTPQRLSRGPGASVPAARPRCRIHGRRVHHRCDADLAFIHAYTTVASPPAGEERLPKRSFASRRPPSIA